MNSIDTELTTDDLQAIYDQAFGGEIVAVQRARKPKRSYQTLIMYAIACSFVVALGAAL